MVNENFLADIYFKFHTMPGWITILRDDGFSEKSIEWLEKMDESQQDVNTAIQDLKKDYVQEYKDGLFAFDEEDIEGKISHLSDKIFKSQDMYATAIKNDVPGTVRWLLYEAEETPRYEKLRNKLRAKQIYKARPISSDSISNAMIERARQYPLENLVEGMVKNKILCPFHDDHNPSMTIKNGWGYCWSCHESCDSIKWLMKVEGYTFQDAVRKLQC